MSSVPSLQTIYVTSFDWIVYSGSLNVNFIVDGFRHWIYRLAILRYH